MSWARYSLSRPTEKINGGVSVKYENPKMEVVVLQYKDVITASGDDLVDEDVGGTGDGDISYPGKRTF